jgi:hypothetical protein
MASLYLFKLQQIDHGNFGLCIPVRTWQPQKLMVYHHFSNL